jgi:rare lipoprotein A
MTAQFFRRRSYRLALGAGLLASAAMLAGCGGVAQLPPVADASASRPAPAARSGPVLPPAGSGRGGYYQDDGPGEAPPGLIDLPDAQPRMEPYSRTGNRPYVVFGKTYTPMTDDRPFKQRGLGSWYGKKFHGQKTSSGEIYDMYKMTAAHPTLPIPSYARVTSVGNGKQVIVRVNDRGPFLHGRIIDLSYTAALKLGYVGKGSTELEVERILPEEIARMESAPPLQAAVTQTAAMPVQSPAVQASPVPAATVQAIPVSSSAPLTAPAVERLPADMASAATPVAPTVAAARPVSGGFYLQLGAYGQAANAEAARSRLAQGWGAGLNNVPPPEVVQSGALFRLHSGPFATRADADAAARQLRETGLATPVVVQR